MSARMGLWIDHEQAIVVALTDSGEEIGRIESNVDTQSRLHDQADDHRQRALTGHLNVYYDAVIDRIGEAESILIFGPGEAKTELRKRLETHKLDGRIVGVDLRDGGTVSYRRGSPPLQQHHHLRGHQSF